MVNYGLRLDQLDLSDEDDVFDSVPDEDSLSEGDETSEYDSEEEAFPVGPVGSVGIRGWRKAPTRRLSDGKTVETRVPWVQHRDRWQEYDESDKSSTWDNANRSFALSLGRAISETPMTGRAAHFGGPDDLSDIQDMLSQMALSAQKQQAALLSSFEQRNKALWSSIENAIAKAEKEDADRRAALEEQRRKQEEAERKAREMREAEEKKLKQEQKERERKEREDREREEREEKERAAQAEQEEKERLAQAEREKATTGLAPGQSPKEQWQKWSAFMADFRTRILATVSENTPYRKACFTAKRAITPKIGQLTASASATLRNIQAVDALLVNVKTQFPSGEPYEWCLNHLSKAIIKQAEQETTAKIETCYPLGRMVVGLLGRGHAQLADILMARLNKKSFWISGYYPPRGTMTSEEHRKVLGYTVTGESSAQYNSRMSGLFALYAAICVTFPTSPPQGPFDPQNVPEQFRPAALWRLLVLLTRPPLIGSAPTPLLMQTILQVAGPVLLRIYGKQMRKLLDCLLRQGIREKKANWNEDNKAGLARLEIWLEEWERGKMEELAGYRPDP